MKDTAHKIKDGLIQLHGKGLFSKEEVTVSISKSLENTGITFVLNDQRISADVDNVLNVTRNTMLGNGIESICLVEHFLATCSLMGVNNIDVITNKNELVFDDGSAMHWYKAFKDTEMCCVINEQFELNEPIFIKEDNKEIIAIPHNGFKVSYFLEWEHISLGKLFASWDKNEDIKRVIQARTFARKEEHDFFGVSDRLLTLDKNGFNKVLHESLEPCYHKILDIIGDLRLCGVNPLEINMHVIGFRSGHALNVQIAKKLKTALFNKI